MTGIDPDEAEDPVAARPRTTPTVVGDVLAGLRRRSGWQASLEGARIHRLWPQVAGAELARHARPVRLRGGVLVVAASSSAWAAQLRYLEADLVRRADAVLGVGSVTKVRITTERPEERPG